MWEAAVLEPKWLIIVGLGLDFIGAVLVAWAVWLRVKTSREWATVVEESPHALRQRRTLVLLGGSLLAGGFGLQMYGTWLQVPV